MPPSVSRMASGVRSGSASSIKVTIPETTAAETDGPAMLGNARSGSNVGRLLGARIVAAGPSLPSRRSDASKRFG